MKKSLNFASTFKVSESNNFIERFPQRLVTKQTLDSKKSEEKLEFFPRNFYLLLKMILLIIGLKLKYAGVDFSIKMIHSILSNPQSSPIYFWQRRRKCLSGRTISTTRDP